MESKCYIVTYETASESSPIITAIKKYDGWAHIGNRVWAITTSKSAVEIRDHLKALVGTNGRVFVIKSGVESAWTNVICSSEWLKKNL